MTLTDRVGELEQRVDNNHLDLLARQQELQHSLESLKLMQTGTLEKIDLLVRKWNEQEKDRKEKGVVTEKSPTASDNSGITQLRPSASHNHGGETVGEWRGENRTRRLEMPVFEGVGPDNWVLRVERYFSINHLTEDEKVEAVAVCFDGEALAWFQWEEKRKPINTWENVKKRLLRRFRASQEGSLCAQFLSLRQESTVREFRRRFETLGSPLTEISEEVMECNFLNRLKPSIRVEVQLLRPMGF